MELVQNSAEHHFVKKLDDLADRAGRWHCLTFSLSKMLAHQSVIADVSNIEARMQEARAKRDQFVKDVYANYHDVLNGFLYTFEDFDVLILCLAENPEAVAKIKTVFQSIAQKLPKGFSEHAVLGGTLSVYHKMADRKLLGAQLHQSYRCMADANKVSSIAARRRRRTEPLVMIVEDDRFTAHFASTILSRDYDMVLCRTAEEAIEAYVEKAPDIVFMDIHLPGMSGHDAVAAIYAADPEAYVVMLSVDSVKESVVKASLNGARKFLRKPFTKDRLIETVKGSPYVRALMRTVSTGHETLMS